MEDGLLHKKIHEDILREKEKNERAKDAKSKAKNTLQKILKFGTGKEDEPGTFRYYYNRPFVAVSNLLDRIGLSLDRLIWGDDDNPENGLYGYLFKKGEEFKDWLDKRFKVKENFNKLKTWLFGDDENEGKLSALKRETGEQLHKAGRWFGNTVKQFFGKGDRKWRRRKPETAAYGRKVTKSGIVAVSEGELIIPSEYNPFYHGKTNKRQQVLNEQRIVDNFYGSFATGGTVGEDYRDRINRTKERLKINMKSSERTKDLVEDLSGKVLKLLELDFLISFILYLELTMKRKLKKIIKLSKM